MAKKETTIEDLAIMVQKGFLSMDEKFCEVNEKINKVQSDTGHLKLDTSFLKAQLSNLKIRIEKMEKVLDQTNNYIANLEFEDLMGRVKYLELKLGIESGK